MAKEYILKETGLHANYMKSRAKIQFFGGGYGNGKSSAMVMKALQIAADYPGMNGLMARSTYPKLNDTLRVTFEDFCPEEWIESFPKSKNSDNSCTLMNASKFNFRYVAQKSSTEDGGRTSNLLSATYDLIVLDQIEDPEITYKDFLDLLGRLRGSTLYRGDDLTMPRTGPRWFLISANPTRNWVYTKIIAPVKLYERTGQVTDDLLCLRDRDGKPVLIEGKPQLLIEIFEGSTYENAHVLEADFIETLESSYRGQMRDRYLEGKWSSYEGLVYPSYDSAVHHVQHHRVVGLLFQLRAKGFKINFLEAYDFGITSPSCYLLAFIDQRGNVIILDGFYKREFAIEDQAKKIKEIREKYNVNESIIYADPDIFRKKATSGKLVGKSVSEIFFEENPELLFSPGNNDIKNGIIKVTSYLNSWRGHLNPFTGERNSPYLYISTNVPFVDEEITAYMWKENKHGEREDTPVDRADHAMDALKYMLSFSPEPSILSRRISSEPSYLTRWQEVDRQEDKNAHRHR